MKIKEKLKKSEEKELDDKMKHLENMKDDNTKYHYVIRNMLD